MLAADNTTLSSDGPSSFDCISCKGLIRDFDSAALRVRMLPLHAPQRVLKPKTGPLMLSFGFSINIQVHPQKTMSSFNA
jgi:hypothetical protein